MNKTIENTTDKPCKTVATSAIIDAAVTLAMAAAIGAAVYLLMPVAEGAAHFVS